MKYRARLLAWLLAACVLGINGFQAYWLYNTYRLTRRHLDEATHEALVAAVHQLLVTAALQRTPGFNLVITHKGAEQVGARRTLYSPHVHIVSNGSSKQGAAGVNRHVSHITIDDWNSGVPLRLADLTRVFRAQLAEDGIVYAVQLDTFSLRRAAPPAGQSARPSVASANLALWTPPVLLNPRRELYVRALLPQPAFYEWTRLGSQLGASLLLLVFTTGCFWLVWYTLQTQRKLAEAKTDFINNMTHELKTPLTTVAAAVETLERFGLQADPLKVQAYLRISRTELRRLADLVDKTLAMAAKEHSFLVLNTEAVHPAELVQAAVHRHQLHASKPVHFEVDMAPDEAVQADRLHLTGIIDNLIDNAIKYSAECVSIHLRSCRTAQGWQLTVQDNGLGIARSYQAAVFDRFFRVPTGDLHPVKGFGLGLYYVRQVVEHHGGRIAVRSELGRGSVFTLWLP